ncbi:MAG: hypothetical protein AAGC71_12545 [Pseudomonadota bacterium]
MSEDIYAPPESDVDFTATNPDGVQFYVVSLRKFFLLSILTMNLYYVYWFYRNWRDVKQSIGGDEWPVMRAIFYIFFTHSLLGLVNDKLEDTQTDFKWSPRTTATAFVLLTLVANIIANFPGEGGFGLWAIGIGLGAVPILAILLSKGQAAINIASGDPDGSSNNALTVANWLWMLLGVLFWLSNLFVVYALIVAPEIVG